MSSHSDKKKIGLIGSFVLDCIYPFRGVKIEGIGGLYYSLITQSCLMKDTVLLYPFAKVGEDFYPRLIKILNKFKNINVKGLIKVTQPNNRVYLKYYSESERNEYSLNVLPSLRYYEMNFPDGLDFLYINFISGRELRLQTLKKIRKNLSCPIHIDFHYLSLGFRKNGLRYVRPFPNWREWLRCGDIIQMNENESRLLFGKDSNSHYTKLAEEILSNGSKVFLLTLGEKGSILFYINDSKVKKVDIPSFSYSDVSEVTGCGDAYAVGFLCEYLLSRNPEKSAIFASKVAGFKAGLTGSDKLSYFKKFKG